MTNDRTLFIEENIEFYNKYSKSLKELELLKKYQTELRPKNINVFYGVSGAGKTYKVYTDCAEGSVYKYVYSSTGIWFDGYDPIRHKTLLIDEFKG